jgi:hypothetical protein
MFKLITPAISPFDAQLADEFLKEVASTIEELNKFIRAGKRGPFAVPTSQFNVVKVNFEQAGCSRSLGDDVITWKVKLLGVNPTLATFTIRASNEPEDTQSEADLLRPKAAAFEELAPWLKRLAEAIKDEPGVTANQNPIEAALATLVRLRNEHDRLLADSELLQQLRAGCS